MENLSCLPGQFAPLHPVSPFMNTYRDIICVNILKRIRKVQAIFSVILAGMIAQIILHEIRFPCLRHLVHSAFTTYLLC